METRVPIHIPPPYARHGFTLLEMVVILGILTVLVVLLLPSLGAARDQAGRVQCVANLRALGGAAMTHALDHQGFYPAAFSYRGTRISGSVQTPASPMQGYTHWSGVLLREGLLGESALKCPAFRRGGLPPANTTDGNLDEGQCSETPGIVDDQAPRCAYSVNQALFAAHHMVSGFQGAVRPCRPVRVLSVVSPAETIAATEWNTDWKMLAEPGTRVCRSYLPVHGFLGLGPQLSGNRTDTRRFGSPRICWAAMRRVTLSDLSPSPSPPGANLTRLDWVGRNHAKKGVVGSRTSNFLYADGRVANTTIFDTVRPFQWGREFLSLQPGNDISD